MATSPEESFQKLLDKATDPIGLQTDWNAIYAVSQKVTKMAKPEEIQEALSLFVRHMHSTHEIESINALKTLEACVERCGNIAFCDEVGKFRFLNELIKLVSPKYLGNKTSPAVKQKVIEILYSWSCSMKDCPKFEQAYSMLKRQGVVTQDPILAVTGTPPAVPPRPKDDIFDDEEKAKVLHKLLHSTNRDDYQAANRLIKNMVKEHDRHVEMIAKRETDLETVSTNVNVLDDMLRNYRPGVTSEEEIEVMKELYKTCENWRPNMFRMASETDDKDNSLSRILKNNDELSEVMERYKKVFGVSNVESVSSTTTENEKGGTGLSLLDLGSPGSDLKTANLSSITLDDQLLSFGSEEETSATCMEADVKSNVDVLSDIFTCVSTTQNPVSTNQHEMKAILTPLKTSTKIDLDRILSTSLPTGAAAAANGASTAAAETKKASKGLDDLDSLGFNLLKQSLPSNASLGSEFHKPVEKLSMNQMRQQSQSPPVSTASLLRTAQPPTLTSAVAESSHTEQEKLPSLGDISVSLESVKPGNVTPLTLYDENDISVVIHFGSGHLKPCVFVMVITSLNKGPSAIPDLHVQMTVSKGSKIRLLPPSDTHLTAFNPILPPPCITQIMLLAKSSKDPVKLKYTIAYTQNENNFVHVGEVENLPLE